jgi:hypothetical protein
MEAEASMELIQLMETVIEMNLVSGTGPLMQALDGGLGDKLSESISKIEAY